VLYEVWSLGHKPFEDMTAQEVGVALTCCLKLILYTRHWKGLRLGTDSHHLLAVPELFTEL